MRTALLLCALAFPVALHAQPVDLPIPPATTDRYPPGVHVLHLPGGAVYADAQGHVLYGMDMRVLLRSGPDPSQHCDDACAKVWQPLLAPAGSSPNTVYGQGFGRPPDERQAANERPRVSEDGAHRAPVRARGPDQGGPPPGGQRNVIDWAIIAGPQGPQWVYKNWHMVFTRRGDRPGSTAFDGADNLVWNTLKFVPPVPVIVAPANVQPLALKGSYVLADKDGHVLFTGSCTKTCAGWQPLGAGMASAPIGEWTVNTSGDAPQWMWRGKPVFVSQEDDPKQVPAPGQPLKL